MRGYFSIIVSAAAAAAIAQVTGTNPPPSGSTPSTASQIPSQSIQGPQYKDIWQPTKDIKTQHITLEPFGSGSIAETTETQNDGAYSIRISTHNYFQGGILKLATPIDLSASFNDPTNMLDVSVRSADTVVIGAGKGAFMIPGEEDWPAAGPSLGAAIQGGRKVSVGGAGSSNESTNTSKKNTGIMVPANALQKLRVVITTTDGLNSETYLPVPYANKKDPWVEVAIPLSSINGFSRTNKIVESMSFSGDKTSTFYLGDIRIVHDDTPITGEMNVTEPLNLALGDTVKFIGYGYGGATVLKYSWDFDAADGIQEDAVGQAVEHKFRTPGTFTVTCTISDFYGIKKPFSCTATVKVNP